MTSAAVETATGSIRHLVSDASEDNRNIFLTKEAKTTYPGMANTTEELKKHRRLIRYTARPFKDQGVAEEDLVQEASLAFVECLSSWDPNKGASVWTYARPRVLGALFKAVGRQMVEASSPTEKDLLQDYASEDLYPSPEDFFFVEEQKQLAAKAISALSAEDRKLLDAWMHADSLDELGSSLGTSRQTVHARVKNVIGRIRDHVQRMS